MAYCTVFEKIIKDEKCCDILDFCNYIKPCFLVSFSVTTVQITHKIRTKEFAHPNAISQKTQGKYTCMVHWVGHVLKNFIELYPIQKSNVVVLLKMLRLSLKPKILHNFKTTWVFFKIENGPNSGNAKPLCAFTKLSLASFCKKVIENISAVSIVTRAVSDCLIRPLPASVNALLVNCA